MSDIAPELEIQTRLVSEIYPSPENDGIYNPFNPEHGDDRQLIESVRESGIRVPLSVTRDGYILSGHRRYNAALIVGLRELPVRIEPIDYSTCSSTEWVKLLKDFNTQRNKTLDEVLREEVIAVAPEDAHRQLVAHRRKLSAIPVESLTIEGKMNRSVISPAKEPFLNAVARVLSSFYEYLPVSVRSIHYALLNDPPLMHAKKPYSRYENSKRCYQALDELVTRARIAGLIPWGCIKDETRPVETWAIYNDPQLFIRERLDNFLKFYNRDLMQSQPNHIEIVVEKKTMTALVQRVAQDYTIPVTSGGGFCSLPPRYEMAQRYRRSGKSRLVLVLLSDHDPDGIEISQSFARSMRDDFGVEDIDFFRAAITKEQITRLHLQPNMIAKQTSKNYQKFVDEYGEDVFELEAIPPAELEKILRSTIDGIIDQAAFLYEQKREESDAAFLNDVQQRTVSVLKSICNG